MSEFFKTSVTWVVDFRYDGHPRRWFKLLPQGQDAQVAMATLLHDLYGARAELAAVRQATPDEEAAYLRGDAPQNPVCPTGRR